MQQLHGSGKTAVLVERIINKIIEENIDIDKLLVVTFTNAAASEMRERVLNAIYEKIEEKPENEKLQRQINLLNKANICTIDSFCLEVVKNYFYELEGISPNFRIADTTEIELLKQEIIEELFEKKYENQNEDFLKLINIYTGYRDDTPLKELILKIYSYIQSNPFPEKWLNEKIEMFNIKNQMGEDFSKTEWGKELLNEMKEELIDSTSILEQQRKKLTLNDELEIYEQTLINDIDKIQEFKNSLENWDLAFEKAQTFGLEDWPKNRKISSDLKDEIKKIRGDVKQNLKKKKNKILKCDSKEANQDIYNMYEILKKLESLILEFEEEFLKRKREKNIVDFNDIEHLALKILIKQDEDGNISKTDVAKKYEEKFIEIAIDEYQDSNLVQEYILTSVSKNNNIFMVGDIKQSIYKFRQAMPELFKSKYDNYEIYKENVEAEKGLKIQLFMNFRSRDNILDFTNTIFENIMSDILGDLNYNNDEFLYHGADYDEPKQDLKTEIDIIDLKETEEDKQVYNYEENESEEDDDEEENQEAKNEVERIEDVELEARYVANKIKKLVNDKFQIYDKKIENDNKFRDAKYKDIVILLRSTKDVAAIYEQELIKLDIPVFSDSSQEYLNSIEIQTIMCLLKIIDNPIQDIPLVTVLRSCIGGFSDDDLVQIRLSDKYDNFYRCMKKAVLDVDKILKNKIEKFLDNLDRWREEQEYLALDEFIWKLYTDTGYYNYVGLMNNGMLRQANLKMLFERAKKYEKSSFKGLYNFIHFIEKLKIGNGDLGSAKLIGENDNVVRIMSIHKSKGLEFPIVILSSMGKEFNLMDLNKKVLLHQDMGIGVKYIDYERQIQYDTLSKLAVRNKMLVDNLSEEMRVLYVALTRAKEKLIITARFRDFEKDYKGIQEKANQYKKIDKKINPIILKKYKRFIDWILLTYCYEKNKLDKLISLNIKNKQDLIKTFSQEEEKDVDVVKLLDDVKIEKNKLHKIAEIVERKYQHLMSTTMITKTSVSNIKQGEYENSRTFQNGKDASIKDEDDQYKIKKKNEEEFIQVVNFATPKFLKEDKDEKLSGAQKGTLVHLCMQRLNTNEDYDLNKVKQLIEDMCLKKIITEKEAENINPYKILEFTKTEIWQELKTAKEIYREKPFYINIQSKDIFENGNNERVLVQGIIDLYYINSKDELILVDYKTDYVHKEKELINKYQVQIDIYKQALEEVYERKVDRAYIYSTFLGTIFLGDGDEILKGHNQENLETSKNI